MPSYNDFSIISCSTKSGNELTTVLTGNGINDFQVKALRSMESIIQNSGYPNYKLSTIDAVALTNSRLFYDTDSAVAQTVPPTEAILLNFLLQQDTYDNQDGSGLVAAASDQETFITTLVSKLYLLFVRSSTTLDSVDPGTTTDTTSGRLQECRDETLYKTTVNVY